ncbi:sperm flagellar protein 2-like [Planoprotostelium fungivorum]|uniref:Sperm flagellar protein 2-like n=1 Tax=Planoprotostelium fungivorum TaxID=1890364 RepID=A0A2P6NQG2_9EUKA|nr:sperm flagellar protein 2-like [Planoprotostelium fungivorum]
MMQQPRRRVASPSVLPPLPGRVSTPPKDEPATFIPQGRANELTPLNLTGNRTKKSPGENHRDKRRKRGLQEQQQIILEKLLKQSRDERNLAAELLEVRRQKEVIRQNRIERERQCAETKRKQFEEALERDAHLARMNRADYEQHIVSLKEKLKELEDSRATEKRERHYQKCRASVLGMVDIALKVVEFKELSGGETPNREYIEWKTLYRRGESLFDEIETAPSISPEEQVLNEEDYENYVASKAFWKYDSPTPLHDTDTWQSLLEKGDQSMYWREENAPEEKNHILGLVIEELLTLAAPPTPPPEVELYPQTPLRLALLGKNLSGKTTIARSLASKFSMAIINVDEVLAETISGRGAPVNDKTLKAGRAMDDTSLVHAVCEKIQTLENQMKETGTYPGGWVLEDFPRNANQAEMLEKKLTGYETPAKLLRRRKAKRSSRIAASPLKTESSVTPRSVFDAVVRLEVEDEVVLRRGSGKRIDPVTGQDQQMISQRLVSTDTSVSSVNQIRHQLVAFGENKKLLEEWFKPFSNLVVIPSGDIKATEKACWTVLTGTATKKVNAGPAEEIKIGSLNGTLNANGLPTTPDSNLQSARQDRPPSSMSSGTNNGIALPSEPIAVVPPIPTSIAPPTPRLNKDLAVMLVDKWSKVENHFVSGLKSVFQTIRNQYKQFLLHFSDVRKDFLTFLNRPDNFQEFIDPFVRSFNEIDADMRDDIDTKQELHQRVEDLREMLWQGSDKRKDEAEDARNKIVRSGWVEDQLAVLLNNFITLMQLEVDRHFESRQIIIDYNKGITGEPLDVSFKAVDLPFLGSSLKFQHPLLGMKIKKKKKLSTTKTSSRKEDPWPDITQTAEKALSLILRPEPDTRARISTANIVPPAPTPPPTSTTKEKDPTQVLSTPNSDVPTVFDADAALRLEDIILLRRIERIHSVAFRTLDELKKKADQSFQLLDDWLGERFKLEVHNIEQLAAHIKNVIESEGPLTSLKVDACTIYHTHEENVPSDLQSPALEVEPTNLCE